MGMRFACALRCLRKKQQETVLETEIKVSDPSRGTITLGQLWFLPLCLHPVCCTRTAQVLI